MTRREVLDIVQEVLDLTSEDFDNNSLSKDDDLLLNDAADDDTYGDQVSSKPPRGKE